VLLSPRSWSTAQRLDAIGSGIVALLAVWVGAFAGGGEGRPWPVLWLLAGLVAAFNVGRMVATRPQLVPGLLAVGVAGAFVLTWPGVRGAGGAPTGYGNTNATLAALGVIAALAAARHTRPGADRNAWLLLAGLLLLFVVLTRSVAGMGSLALVLGLLVAPLAMRARRPSLPLAGGLGTLAVLLVVTGVVASGRDLPVVDDVRAGLWQVAGGLIRDEPLRGVGPGMFAELSPETDADLRWAHHEYLQVGAELGLVGLLLVLAGIAWVFVRLAVACRSSSAAVIASTAAIVVTVHAAFDYVWHVPAIPLVATALMGSAIGPPSRRAVVARE
jgi:O-antigen ligase